MNYRGGVILPSLCFTLLLPRHSLSGATTRRTLKELEASYLYQSALRKVPDDTVVVVRLQDDVTGGDNARQIMTQYSRTRAVFDLARFTRKH